MVVERRSCELRADDSAALPTDQPLQLRVEGETVTIGELAECIPRLNRDLDGSRFRHTDEYTDRQGDSRTRPASHASAPWAAATAVLNEACSR